MAMDLAMAQMVRKDYLIQWRAAAASATSDEDVGQKSRSVFYQNYPTSKIGATCDLERDHRWRRYIVSVKADYDTSFSKLLGIDRLDR